MKNPKFVKAIKNNFPGVYDITEPNVLGINSNILIAHTPKKKIVCKFDKESVCRHDRYVSEKLRKNDICVPNIKIANYDGLFFTTYEYNPNKTLAEWIKLGLPRDLIFSIYCDAMDVVYKISNVNIPNQKMSYDMFNSHQDFIANKIFDMPMKLYHNDLHAGNILLGPRWEFAGLLDMASVSMTTLNTFLASVAVKYPCYCSETDFWGLVKHWEKISGQSIERERFKSICNMIQPRKCSR